MIIHICAFLGFNSSDVTCLGIRVLKDDLQLASEQDFCAVELARALASRVHLLKPPSPKLRKTMPVARVGNTAGRHIHLASPALPKGEFIVQQSVPNFGSLGR